MTKLVLVRGREERKCLDSGERRMESRFVYDDMG